MVISDIRLKVPMFEDVFEQLYQSRAIVPRHQMGDDYFFCGLEILQPFPPKIVIFFFWYFSLRILNPFRDFRLKSFDQLTHSNYRIFSILTTEIDDQQNNRLIQLLSSIIIVEQRVKYSLHPVAQ